MIPWTPMRRARAAALPSLSAASSSLTSACPAAIEEGCQSIARPAEWMLADFLPHLSQRYSPQLTPLEFFSSQWTMARVPAKTWPPLHLVASSYWIGSIPLLRSLFAGFAETLGRAEAAAGIASAIAAARQTMYLIRVSTPLISAEHELQQARGRSAGHAQAGIGSRASPKRVAAASRS